MADKAGELDLKDSILPIDGTAKDQERWSKLIDQRANYLINDKSEREKIYKMRRDFYVGNHGKYTNIVGLQQKEKRGHANSVINYAGASAKKIAYSLSNNPPNITYPLDIFYKPEDLDYQIEETRTQAVEDFTEDVLRRNRFWKSPYRRAVFNQVIVGDLALKVYPENRGSEEAPNWEIKIVSMEKMENLMVGWRGDDSRAFDYVVAEQEMSVQSVKELWGIEVPKSALSKKHENSTEISAGAHNSNQEWGVKNVGLGGRSVLPSGNTNIPTVLVREYDDENIYAIKIAGQLVQLVFKDGKSLPKKFKLWILGENIPNPGNPWSISDIDYLIDPNIELNEASNEERDYIRVGANQKFLAYNMNDFDPESIKPGSGGVIFIESADGSSKFEPLQSNVNNYPAESYLNRVKKHIHDLGVPEVTFGAAGSDSGRSKAIDYQSMVDLTVFKRDAWEIVLEQLCEKIQVLGYFLFRADFFKDAKTQSFKVRYPELDWSDIVPITQSDKIVNIVNKVQMGLPFEIAYKELGYRDVDAVINLMKQEAADPLLMAFRAKAFQATPGLTEATVNSQMAMGQMGQMPEGGMTGEGGMMDVNAQNASPMMTSDQNSGAMPMSQQDGTTSFSSPTGFINQTRQNLRAQGR